MLDLFAIVFSSITICALHISCRKPHRDRHPGRLLRHPGLLPERGEQHALIGLVFALAGVLAGVSGTFLGMKYMVYPTMGWITNKAYIAAVIGGLGSLPGAVVGGIMLGVLETFVSAYVSSVVPGRVQFLPPGLAAHGHARRAVRPV